MKNKKDEKIKYLTSPQLEKIVSSFRMRICEIIPGMSGGDRVFRFDFKTISDSGEPFVAGSIACGFFSDDNPRDISKTLRKMANALDDFWARAFPSAINKKEGKSD